MSLIEKPESMQQMLTTRISELMEDPTFGEKITPETNLIEAGMSSIVLVKLIVDIEQYFGFTFEDEEMLEDNFKTLDQIMSNISKKLNSEA